MLSRENPRCRLRMSGFCLRGGSRHGLCCAPNAGVSPNPHVEVLTPNVVVSGGTAFGSHLRLAHGHGTLMMGCVPYRKRRRERALLVSARTHMRAP